MNTTDTDQLTKTADSNQFTVGTKAYYDTLFHGLIPCVVIGVERKCYGFRCGPNAVSIRLTADRGAYKRGEVLKIDGMHAPPRKMVRTSRGHYRIRTYYSYVPQDSIKCD